MHNRVLIAVAAGAALLGLWLARAPALTAADAGQPRLSQPAPVPAPPAALVQTFSAHHDGLSSVEVLAVYHGTPGDGGAALTLRLWGPGDVLVAEQSLSAFEHNAPLRLSFTPQPRSAGQTFRLEVSGAQAALTTLWAYHLDGYADGDLRLSGEPVPGDLRFSTSYTYLWPSLLREMAVALSQLAGLAVPLWLVLFAPGLFLLDTLKPAVFTETRWARWGGALALSLAVLPLAWLWVTTLGLAWSRLSLGAVYAALGALVAGRWLLVAVRAVLRRRVRVRAAAFPGSHPVPVRFVSPAAQPGLTRYDAAVGAVVLLSLLLRLLAMRDLALPAWVDSSHHALVTGLLAEAGRVPATYGPLLDAGTFTYHFGVHAVLAALDWFSPLALTQVMLLAGQVLNGLMSLAVYASVATFTHRRWAPVGAAFYVGVVSLFPGYYVTWGRYSQLAGLLLLAPACAAVWALLALGRAQPSPERALYWRLAAVIGLLAAGILLAHYRVFLFFVAFVLVAGLLHLRVGWRRLGWLGAAAALGALLALPWLARLAAAAVLPLAGQRGGLAANASYNAFPVGYFDGVLERAALGLGLAALVWGFLRRDKVVWAIALWVGGVFGLLNLGAATWLVNNNAWAISLFVPVALLLGWGLDECLTRARRLLAAAPTLVGALPPWRRAARLAGGLALVAALAFAAAYAGLAGARAQIAIINPVTLLATAGDRQALDWVVANTAPDAVFLVNGWQWQGGSWAGSDGGAWLLPLAGRRVTLPPITYEFGGLAQRIAIHDLAARVSEIRDVDEAGALALFRGAGVTHVFIGARGGSLQPEMFVSSPAYRLLFSNGAAWVFELIDEE